MPEELKTTGFKKWHDVRLRPDGSVEELTRVRFWLGGHGPFELTFPRDVDDVTIGTAIARERASIESVARY